MKLLTLWSAYLRVDAKIANWDGLERMEGPLNDQQWNSRSRLVRQCDRLKKAITKRIAKLEGQQ